jgi:putative ABC transport system substrate-binding protein
VKRREFITLVGGAAAAWPTVARGQTDQIRRIGFLTSQLEGDREAVTYITAFRRGLKELGWVERHNLQIDYRWAAVNLVQARTLAAELLGLNPSVIVALGTPLVSALHQQTRSVPIVFVSANDPVGFGFIESLAHPGGNITGFVAAEPSMGSKWLEMLKMIAPGVSKVALIFNPQTHSGQYFDAIEGVAPSFGMTVQNAPFSDAVEIERAFAAFALESNGGLLVLPDISTNVHGDLIVALAARHRLPAIYMFPHFPRNGGLVSYGADNVDLHRRAATYVDRILRGDKPADLPVQLPTKFELVINLKTAKNLGLAFPTALLATADEVIE